MARETKWRQPVHHHLWSQQSHFTPHSTALKSIPQEEWSLHGISDVVIASVHYEKTSFKKLMIRIMIIIITIIIIIMNKLQETTFFSGR